MIHSAHNPKPSICFLIPQFGMIPGYINYFMLTAAHSSGLIDFHFFTDQSIKVHHSIKNVFVTKMTLKEFNKLASQKLSHSFTITKTYKLCDMKPMYGLIFEDRIKSYEFWGHCDFDMIFGNLKYFLNANQFSQFDIFSVQSLYASGPFLIFRNTPRVNHFFKQSTSWKMVLDHPTYKGFDEAGDVIRDIWKGKSIKDCTGEIQSMTHLMKDDDLLLKQNIRVSMKELITEGFQKGDRITFDKGNLVLYPSNTELYIYHFMNRKNLLLFNDMLWDKSISSFQFSDRGFTTGNRLEVVLGFAVSLAKRYWIRVTKKLKSR